MVSAMRLRDHLTSFLCCGFYLIGVASSLSEGRTFNANNYKKVFGKELERVLHSTGSLQQLDLQSSAHDCNICMGCTNYTNGDYIGNVHVFA